MLGRMPISLEGGKALPEYVEQVGQALKQAYDKVRHSIEEAHKANKARYDKKESGCNFTVGDLVWLCAPAIKPENYPVCGEGHIPLWMKLVLLTIGSNC